MVTLSPDKIPFDIDVVMARISAAVKPYPKAALFELADEGFATPFEQTLACIISVRTRDEVTLPVAHDLFARARTPADVAQLLPEQIDAIIRRSTFHATKAQNIQQIARRVVEDYGGVLPCDEVILRTLPGVGPKCANLVLGIACGQPRIAVDVHVQRVTNRWGYVHTQTPEQTMMALEEKLPRRYWVEINRVLVPFGKHRCTAQLPRCTTCPVLNMCQQIGVTLHR